MLHDKATISQSLARGFDLCGRREGGAAGGSAASWRAGRQDPALHSRAWTGCRAVSSTASRPSRDPVSGGRGEPAEAGERTLLHPHNVPWAELLVLAAGSGSQKQGERVSGTQRPVSGCLTREGYRTCIVSRGVRGQRTCGRVCLSFFF